MSSDVPYEAGSYETLMGKLVPVETYIFYLDRVPRSRSMAFKNLDLYAGNDKTYIIYIKDRDLQTVDLTGHQAAMTWKETKDGPVVLQKSTTNSGEARIIAPTKGEIYFYIKAADTQSLEPRQYVWDIKVTNSSGGYTVTEGVLTLLQPVNL